MATTAPESVAEGGCSGQLGAKVRATEQEVAALGTCIQMVGPGPDESFRREYSTLECYISLRLVLSDGFWRNNSCTLFLVDRIL